MGSTQPHPRPPIGCSRRGEGGPIQWSAPVGLQLPPDCGHRGGIFATALQPCGADFVVGSLARRCDRVVLLRSQTAAQDRAGDGGGRGDDREDKSDDGGEAKDEGCLTAFITHVERFSGG